MVRPIVAGVDGSPHGLAAARYAAALAERHGLPLTLIQAFETVFYGYGPLMAAGSYAVADERLREAARHSLDETAREIRAAHLDLEVQAEVREGRAAAVLIEASQEAYTTVVGARGLGGFAGLLLGSVSTQLAAHGHGPVIVVRPAANPDGPVVVGYDGSDAASAALAFGVREALARKATLVVATVYWERPWGFGPAPAGDPAELARQEAHRMLTEALELPLEEHPDLQAEIRTIHAMDPDHSLIDESVLACLTVVGCRGRGGFAGLLLGSVSQTLVNHAAGPVAVIHPS